MMMDAIGEPHTLQIDRQSLEIVRRAVAHEVLIHSLQGLPDKKIVTTELVGYDVTTA